MTEACVALIQRVENDLRMEIANMSTRLDAEAHLETIRMIRTECEVMLTEMRALATAASNAADATVAEAEAIADEIVNDAGEAAAEAVAEEISEAAEVEEESGEVDEPIIDELPAALESEKDKGPDRTPIWERKLFG